MSSIDTATSLRLTPSQIYYLDGFRARVRRDTGFRMPRARLVQALLEAIEDESPDLATVLLDFASRATAEAPSSITLRISNDSVFKLQLLAAQIRYRSGRSMSYSAIVRGLIEWMSECDIDTHAITEFGDLRASLHRSLLAGEVHEGHSART